MLRWVVIFLLGGIALGNTQDAFSNNDVVSYLLSIICNTVKQITDNIEDNKENTDTENKENKEGEEKKAGWIKWGWDITKKGLLKAASFTQSLTKNMYDALTHLDESQKEQKRQQLKFLDEVQQKLKPYKLDAKRHAKDLALLLYPKTFTEQLKGRAWKTAAIVGAVSVAFTFPAVLPLLVTTPALFLYALLPYTWAQNKLKTLMPTLAQKFKIFLSNKKPFDETKAPAQACAQKLGVTDPIEKQTIWSIFANKFTFNAKDNRNTDQCAKLWYTAVPDQNKVEYEKKYANGALKVLSLIYIVENYDRIDNPLSGELLNTNNKDNKDNKITRQQALDYIKFLKQDEGYKDLFKNLGITEETRTTVKISTDPSPDRAKVIVDNAVRFITTITNDIDEIQKKYPPRLS